MVITIASKQPVTMSAAAQTLRLALVPPPDGAAAARPPPRQLAMGQPARHQQGERQFDDEDGLHQRDRAGGQRDGLAHRGQQHHADADQPHLALDQVAEQGQVQCLGGRGGRGGHPLKD
jgi:hypothetical protein